MRKVWHEDGDGGPPRVLTPFLGGKDAVLAGRETDTGGTGATERADEEERRRDGRYRVFEKKLRQRALVADGTGRLGTLLEGSVHAEPSDVAASTTPCGVARSCVPTSPSCDQCDSHGPRVSRQPFGLQTASFVKRGPRSSQDFVPRCPQPAFADPQSSGPDTLGPQLSCSWQDGTRKTSPHISFQRQHRGLRCPRDPRRTNKKNWFLSLWTQELFQSIK